MERPIGLSPDEWELVLKHRRDRAETAAYNRGLEAAAFLAKQWARECGGGSGQGGSGYLNLADAIMRLCK
jgi:hypothetical protein